MRVQSASMSLILSPALSCRGHVRPFLFAGVQNFF
jgi:hypothetical protein